jgi:tetratricopeptide (TPR) repeat protein
MNPFTLLLIGAVGLFLYSCSTTKELADRKSSAKEFFDPVQTLPKLPSAGGRESGNPDTSVNSRERRESAEFEALVREQNLKLRMIVDQVKSADDQTADKRSAFDELDRNILAVEAKRASSLDREIIDLLKEQNSHLMEVLDQLRVLLLKRPEVRQEGMAATLQSRSAPQTHQLQKNATRSVYSRAIKMYRERQFEQAIHALQQLEKGEIDENLADNSRLRTDASYFHLQRYKEAIPPFQLLLSDLWSEKREGTYIIVQLNPVCDLTYLTHVKLLMLL